MKYGSLILEKKEYVYVKRLLNISGYTATAASHAALQVLSQGLKQALIVDEVDMPEDIVRLNSLVSITPLPDAEWKKDIRLVIPMEEDVKQNKISVLTPLGCTLLGYSQGDKVTLNFPNQKEKKLILQKVQQDKNAERIDVPI